MLVLSRSKTRLCWNWLNEISDCLKNEICICISEMEENSEGLLPSLLPQVGMEFTTIEEAWMFWISYGGQKGFEVRKKYTNKRKSYGKVRSYRYVWANEGHRLEDKRDHLTKCPRAETRTDCQVHMGVVMDRVKGTYKVADILQLPQTSHLMVSQRKILEGHLISVTLSVTTRIIYGASANGRWHMVKQEACL